MTAAAHQRCRRLLIGPYQWLRLPVMTLFIEQCLNGLQFGLLLFMLAAGLTLVFGIMNLVNLAHGSLYMVGAYLATYFYQLTGSFALGVLLGLAGTLVVGIVVELVALRTLYERDHLDQVLATFGLILFFNELMAILWGRAAIYADIPPYLSGHVELFAGVRYPLYRLAIIVVGLAVVAVVQILLAVPALVLGNDAGLPVHTARHLGSFAVALGVGFLVVAWKPNRAPGLFPLAAALVACLVLTSIVDVANGRTAALGELSHSTELLGLALCWLVGRSSAATRPAPGHVIPGAA